jgi:hypothetical protein
VAKKLSERDICAKFITPAISARGLDAQNQFRERRALNVHGTRRPLLKHSDCSCPLTLTLSPGGLMIPHK